MIIFKMCHRYNFICVSWEDNL